MSDFHLSYAAEKQRQKLIKEAHSLISVIAAKSSSLKLLRITVNMLRIYSSYKSTRQVVNRK